MVSGISSIIIFITEHYSVYIAIIWPVFYPSFGRNILCENGKLQLFVWIYHHEQGVLMMKWHCFITVIFIWWQSLFIVRQPSDWNTPIRTEILDEQIRHDGLLYIYIVSWNRIQIVVDTCPYKTTLAAMYLPHCSLTATKILVTQYFNVAAH